MIAKKINNFLDLSKYIEGKIGEPVFTSRVVEEAVKLLRKRPKIIIQILTNPRLKDRKYGKIRKSASTTNTDEMRDFIATSIELVPGAKITSLKKLIVEAVVTTEMLDQLINNPKIRKAYKKSQSYKTERQRNQIYTNSTIKALNRRLGALHVRETVHKKIEKQRESAIKASSEWYKKAGIVEDFEEDLNTQGYRVPLFERDFSRAGNKGYNDRFIERL